MTEGRAKPGSLSPHPKEEPTARGLLPEDRSRSVVARSGVGPASHKDEGLHPHRPRPCLLEGKEGLWQEGRQGANRGFLVGLRTSQGFLVELEALLAVCVVETASPPVEHGLAVAPR